MSCTCQGYINQLEQRLNAEGRCGFEKREEILQLNLKNEAQDR